MSYDIWFEMDDGGAGPVRVGGDWNYTSNSWRAWCDAGADLDEFHGKSAEECAIVLEPAINRMRADPAKYRAFDAPNGWGTYDTLVLALERLLAMMRAVPRATVRVWR